MKSHDNVERITICVSTYNNAKFIEKTLIDMFSTAGPIFSFIICDDSSDDGTHDIIRGCVAVSG